MALGTVLVHFSAEVCEDLRTEVRSLHGVAHRTVPSWNSACGLRRG